MNTKSSHLNQGQSLVELALLLPIFLLLAVVTFDIGRGIYYYSAVFNAAREGARYGIIDPDDYAGIDTAARNLAVGLEPSNLYVDTFLNTTAKTIQVRVCYNFKLITPFANNLVTNNPCQGTLAGCTTEKCVKLESRATMSLER
jgi:Flp pilus assembly protein TadG